MLDPIRMMAPNPIRRQGELQVAIRNVSMLRSLPKLATVVMIFLGLSAWGQSIQNLLTFSGANGFNPYTGLVEDARGNFYGATHQGGANNNGVIYKLAKNSSGQWVQTIIYQFSARNGGGDNPDGADPVMGRLAIDAHGFLYGTTTVGGANNSGTVFRLSQISAVGWRFTTLYSFEVGMGGIDGVLGGVVLDRAGNVYGTTSIGGNGNCGGGCGLVYELVATGVNGYSFKILHTFQGIPAQHQCGVVYDGATPQYMIPVLDSPGNLYGTTDYDGVGCGQPGTVWELSPAGGGNWSYTILYSDYNEQPGAYNMLGGVVLDSQGNLYGTSACIVEGNTSGNCAFELIKASGYALQILAQGTGFDNGAAYSTVTFDRGGNLYWVTEGGGPGLCGTVEEAANNGGRWVHSILFEFPSNPGAIYGCNPWGPVVIDSSGNVYGTNIFAGGNSGNEDGTVWEVTP
jgi:uncharacterized repeat protein (TIGR03803 family)